MRGLLSSLALFLLLPPAAGTAASEASPPATAVWPPRHLALERRSREHAGARPNVLLLFVDDWGWGDMGANWPATTETPHMDALARAGLRFTDFHAMSLCTPSRAALLTGRFGLRTGVVTNFNPYSKWGLPLAEITLAERLRSGGYRTGMTGKWHLGMANGHRPTKRGFDFWFGLPLSHDYGCTDHQVANFTYGAGWEYNSSPEGGCDPCPHSGPPPAAAPLSPTNSCNIGANNKWHISPPLFENEQIIEQPVDERYLSPKYAKAAIEFMQGTARLSDYASAWASNMSAPFFLYMAFSHMHTPQHHSSEWDNTSKRKGGHYGDTLAQLDHTVGQVVSAVDSMDIGNDTLIFLTGDNGRPDDTCDSLLYENGFTGSNGPFAGEWLKNNGGGSTGKASTWEGGHREVGVFRWLGHIRPGVTDVLGSTLDITPSVLHLAGIALPTDRTFDGYNLAPVLFDGATAGREIFFFPSQKPSPGAMLTARVHQGAHKYKAIKWTSNKGGCWMEPSGTGSGKTSWHDPPLIFDLSMDEAESTLVNSTMPPAAFAALLEAFEDAFAAINHSIATDGLRSVTNYEQDPAVMLTDMCCNPNHVVCRCNVTSVGALKSDDLLAKSSRMTIPFGGGWRFQLGDDPSGRGPGPGTLSDFEMVPNASCTGLERNPNMRRGRLAPGSQGGNCAVSCAYDPGCFVHQLAFTIPNAHWQQCLHGGAGAVCTPHAQSHAAGVTFETPAYVRTKVSPPWTDYIFAAPGYDDSRWQPVTVPHDALINQTFDPSEDCTYSFLARKVSWYRKHFAVPSHLPEQGGQLFLRFDGVFHHAQIFLNGDLIASHSAGYVPFTVRLDNVSSLRPSGNTLAVRCDATFGSGHWYEGGGIFRPVQLVSVPSRHFVEGGLFADPSTDGTTVNVSIELSHLNSLPQPADSSAQATRVSLRLVDRDTNIVVAETTTEISGSVGTAVLKPSIVLRRWGPSSPEVYTLAARTSTGDALNLSFAARTFDWTSMPGKAVLNREVVELKGFSHHISFAGLGSVQPARLSLFKGQLSRALGANSWRMSHNPYDTELYEVLTELGVLVWDEARDYSPEYATDFREQVKLHRRHPCICIVSYCNEEECCQFDISPAGRSFHDAARELDHNRALSGNYKVQECGMTNASQKPYQRWEALEYSDIIGQSHMGNQTFEEIHQALPAFPMILSESGSCGQTRAVRSAAACETTHNEAALLPYVMGTIGVWSMMDYFGEACSNKNVLNKTGPGPYTDWPAIFGTFGNVDIAGFAKPSAWWYRVNWLAKTAMGAAERPLVGGASNVSVRVLTACEGFTSTPWAEMYVDGVRKDVSRPMAQSGMVHVGGRCDPESPYRNVTLLGLATDRTTVLGQHTMQAPGVATRVELVLDVPSISTGTGSAMYLDGMDVALVRVQLVDVQGTVVTGDDRNVSFHVASGPLRITGVGSGESTNRQHVQGVRYQTFRGLGRVVLQPTVDCTSPGRMLARVIDMNSTLTFTRDCPAIAAVVTAKVDGLPPARLDIPTSGAPQDEPLAVARAFRALDTFTYLDSVQA